MPEIKTLIVGTRFLGPKAVEKVRGCREGQEIDLRREPDNEFDTNAIACYFGELHVGYIPTRDNRVIASNLDRGVAMTASVLSTAQWRSPFIAVRWE